MLFDTSPIEDPDSSKKTKGRRKPAAKEPEVVHEPPPPKPATAAVILGKLDGQVACEDCGAACLDIIDEDGREWQIECCFCGAKSWTPVIKDYLKPKERGFVFHDGRFAGKAIEETAVEPRGMDYIAWAAKEHKRPSVREACQKFLLTTAATVR